MFLLTGNFTYLFNCGIIFTGVMTNFISTLVTMLLGIESSAYNTIFPIHLFGSVCDFEECEGFRE